MLLHRAAAVLILQVCAWSVKARSWPSHDDSVGGGKRGRASGVWGEWSAWTSCTAQCGTGITARTRRCQHPVMLSVDALLSTGDDSVWCEGDEREMKQCNKQVCTDRRLGFREAECAKYKSSVYSLQSYAWEPFIHPSDPCRSSCRAKGYHFYANLAERVVDGTPCVDPSADTPAICVQGVCKEVGCDDIVGSGWRRDACGVCKGDNSTCRGISGIFTRLDLSRGANKIVTIPQGATQVNVSELRPSINHLVLQSLDGEFLLNNVIGRSLPGDYTVGGTVFAYTRGTVECPGDCLFAKGPTDVPLNLMIVAHSRNRGVMYSFNVPLDVTDDYFRQIITGDNTYSSAQETSASTNDQDTDLSTANGDTERDSKMSESDDSSKESEWDDDSESVHKDIEEDSHEENTNSPHVNAEAHSQTDDVNDRDNGKKDGDDFIKYDNEDMVQVTDNADSEDVTDDSKSLSIPAYSVVDPNEMGEDSVFHKNNVQLENHYSDMATPTINVDTSTVLSTTDDVNGQSKPANVTNLEDDYEKATPDSASSFKIIRKEKPKFVNGGGQVAGLSALDGDGGDSQSSTHSGVDNGDDTSHNSDFIQDEGLTSSPSADGLSTKHRHLAPTPTAQHHGQRDEKEHDTTDEYHAVNKAASNTKESVNEKHQNDGPAKSPQQDKESDDTQTSEPGHLLRPQSDSPTYGPFSQREDNRHADRHHYDRRRFRRPNFSQSFTFRHRYHQLVDAENREVADDSGSGHHRRRPSRPATPDGESALHQGSGNYQHNQQGSHHQQQQHHQNRQIRFRQQPRQDLDSQTAQPDREGYEAESREDYIRRVQAQRQALTASQSVSREEQGRQTEATAEQSNARTQAEYEYNRRQEEYRRELLRRRQLYEQQRAAQDAEYQRRLQEHNRRLQERQVEMQRHQQQQQQQLQQHQQQQQQQQHQQQQHQQQQQQQQQEHAARQQHNHRHRHQNHHQHMNGHDRQDQHAGQGHDRQDTNNQGRQGYDQRRPQINAPVAPSGGIISRIDSSVIRQQPAYPTVTDTTTEKQEFGSSYDERLAAQETHRRHQQRIHQQERLGIDLDVGHRRPQHRTQGQDQDVDISGEGTTMQATEPSSTSDFYPSPTSKLSRDYQPLSPTPAPTRGFLTIPQQPQGPTLASREPGVPQYIPDSRFEDRSSLTAALSNQLVDGFESEQRTGLDVNLIPNVIDSQPVIGGGSVTSNVIDDTLTYEWRVSGLTECTLTCGAGVQQTVVVCLDIRTQAYVTDENCGSVERPRPKAVTCNTRPCPAAWQTGEWSACSASCGPGQQTRVVNCAARVSATLNVSMPDENCQSSPRPEARRQCENRACNSWIIGNWSQCSVQCGEGVRTRSVRCADQAGTDVTHTYCTEPKPDQEQPCELGPCGKGWYYTEWQEQCPAQCGAGTKKRHVTCLGEEGAQLPDARCDKFSRPTPEQPCRADVPCGGDWFASEWEECNVACGNGVKQRDVVCMKALPGGLLTVVGDENCAQELKPSTEEPCQLPACAAEWYMTSWFECSQSCGTGHRTREVRCLDPQQEASSDCDLADKPRTREPCNIERCTTPDPRPVSTTTPETQPVSDSDCSDSFSRCEIVKHARMCRYEYYRKKCCATCNGDT